MTWLRYWPAAELIVIMAILSFILMRIWRSAKYRAQHPAPHPTTFGGRVRFILLYLLRILGFGLGLLLGLALFVMLERNILTMLTEMAPAPSEVSVPADLGFTVEDVRFKSTDSLTLSGWYVPAQNGATVILLHGYGGNRTGMIWFAQQLVDSGYGVLMYDERASGESQGDHRSYGWEDPRDVDGAIRFLSERGAADNVGIAGCSTGADIALHSAALNPALDAVWADGASTIRAQDLPAPRDPLMAVITLSNYFLDWAYSVRLSMQPAPLVELLKEIAPRPIVLVGGGMKNPLLGASEGDFYTYRYAQIAGPNAEPWVIPEATHCDGPLQRPEEYSMRLVQFFDKAFDIKR